MAFDSVWVDWPLVLDTETGQAGTAVYVDVDSLDLDVALATAVLGASGDIYNTFSFLASGDAMARGTTRDIKTFMDACGDRKGSEGLLVDSGVNGDGVILYFQKAAQGGTRAAQDASTHHSTTIGDGYLAPRTLSCQHQGVASLSFDVHAVSTDGATAPIAFAETADLPAAQYPTLDNVYGLGLVDLNATPLDGKLNVSIDFGIPVSRLAADGNVYSTVIYAAGSGRIQPSITVTSRSIDLTSSLTEAGLYLASGVEVYFRHLTQGGTFVADATASHIKVGMNKCRCDPVSIGSGPEKQMGVRLTPIYTAGGSPTYPMTIDTASALT